MSYRPLVRLLIAVFISIALLGALGAQSFLKATDTGPESPTAAVEQAWQRVQERGSYEFSSDVVQTTIPEATLFNIGRKSKEERLYLEGESNLQQETMNLKLWSDAAGGGGSNLVPESGIQVEVADGKTRTRRGSGPWEEMDGLVDGYAPQGDFLAYLAAMRDVSRR